MIMTMKPNKIHLEKAKISRTPKEVRIRFCDRCKSYFETKYYHPRCCPNCYASCKSTGRSGKYSLIKRNKRVQIMFTNYELNKINQALERKQPITRSDYLRDLIMREVNGN